MYIFSSRLFIHKNIVNTRGEQQLAHKHMQVFYQLEKKRDEKIKTDKSQKQNTQ
jgi:hypothetical protein